MTGGRADDGDERFEDDRVFGENAWSQPKLWRGRDAVVMLAISLLP
jgi:hypothetical protein